LHLQHLDIQAFNGLRRDVYAVVGFPAYAAIQPVNTTTASISYKGRVDLAGDHRPVKPPGYTRRQRQVRVLLGFDGVKQFYTYAPLDRMGFHYG
jgi:hypothetical protein